MHLNRVKLDSLVFWEFRGLRHPITFVLSLSSFSGCSWDKRTHGPIPDRGTVSILTGLLAYSLIFPLLDLKASSGHNWLERLFFNLSQFSNMIAVDLVLATLFSN